MLNAETLRAAPATAALNVSGAKVKVGRIPMPKLNVQIGREQHGGGRWGFSGAIDELGIYDHVLTQNDISALMNNELKLKPLHSWKGEALPAKAAGS